MMPMNIFKVCAAYENQSELIDTALKKKYTFESKNEPFSLRCQKKNY